MVIFAYFFCKIELNALAIYMIIEENRIKINTNHTMGGTQFMNLEYNREQVAETIDKIVDKTMQMDLSWDWPCGVAYYGIGEAYEKTGKEEYLTLLKDRVDELIDLGLPKVWTVNACAMGHCLITLYKATGDQKIGRAHV